MAHKVSGTSNDGAQIIVINENDWSVEASESKSPYGYTMSNLVSGTKMVIARNTHGEVIGYGNIQSQFDIPQAAGGTITYDGDYRIHTFTSTDQLNMVVGGEAEVLLVGAGGGGGYGTGGGGGAGGLIYLPSITISGGLHDVSIGLPQGTIGYNNPGDNGQPSIFYGLTALGGGGGGSQASNPVNRNGKVGGSGGGGCGIEAGAGAAGTEDQGHNGGGGSNAYQNWPAGGGGGADTAGGNNGGDGLQIDITGTPTYYAGGGGGGQYTSGFTGGLGGGGDWGQPGTANTGGGGGGGKDQAFGGAGGSGIIIVRYKYQ